jgi:vancomycin permeability regulator SanA
VFRGGLILGAVLALLALWAPRRIVERRFAGRIYTAEDAPSAPVAVVFGAGLRRDGRPTAVLYDRVAAAVQLYRAGKVEQLLMSGTRSSESYDEPAAMRDLAIELGVPGQAIQVDGQGTRTFASCERAAETFGYGQALLVSQRYHLPRALATCEALGIQADGVSADLRPYNPRVYRYWETREVLATTVALLETLFRGG